MVETIEFSRSLYEPEAVRAAAEAYSALARIEVVEQDNQIVVTLADPDPAVADEIVGAFSNHALHETILRRRQASGEARP